MRQIAQVIGCVPSSGVHWEHLFDGEGPAGLDPKPQKSGAKSRLSDQQREGLRAALLEGARAHGWKTDLWTLPRVARLIQKEFGVAYHVSHVHRLLGSLGFSAQKPARRAHEQSPEAVAAFRKKRWPAIKKARQEGRSIVLIDESGFMMQPLVRRTWAPVGVTPVHVASA